VMPYLAALRDAYAVPCLQCLSSYLWGWLSDRVGRKPVILFGICAMGSSMLGLGLSWSLPLAAASRCAGGFFNGIIGALKTIIAEAFEEHDQAKVCSVSWALNCTI
jgi:MFS family permease